MFNQRFRDICLTLLKKIKDLYTKKISPYKAFGNYLAWGLVFGIGFMLLFVKLAEDVINDELKIFDQTIINLFNPIRSPLTTQIMKVITTMGSPLVMITLGLITWFYFFKIRKHFWDSTMVITALAGSWLMNELLKWIFHRRRPDVLQLIRVSGYSFPSGHAMVSFAFYGMLAYLIWINVKAKKLKYLLSSFFLLLILAIGISRIYLGVHYPSDVIAGFSAGGLWLIGCILALQVIR